MERSSWTLILLAALGCAALVLAFAPSAWPNPVVADGAVVEERVLPELSSAARAVDAACRRGDEARFAELTTSAYREELQGRLQAVDAKLDAETMRKMADSGGADSDWLRRPLLATHAVSADVAIAVEFARPLVYRAAWSVARPATHDPVTRGRDVSMAKSQASDAVDRAARAALQCHGAIGYTFEYDLQLWLKRGWALAAAHGDARRHRDRVAAALVLR